MNQPGPVPIDAGEFEHRNAFCTVCVRYALIYGDAVGFHCGIGYCYSITIVPSDAALAAALTAGAGSAPMGVERAFPSEHHLELFLQGMEAVMRSLGDHHFPTTMAQWRYRSATAIAAAEEE